MFNFINFKLPTKLFVVKNKKLNLSNASTSQNNNQKPPMTLPIRANHLKWCTHAQKKKKEHH